MADVRYPKPPALLDTFQRPAIVGRWLLVSAETVQTILLIAAQKLIHPQIAVLLVLFAYNAASLIVISLVPLSRLRVYLMIILDMIGVAVASDVTGGSHSPFINECFLIIFAASLFYGLSGGIGAGLASAVIEGVLISRLPVAGMAEVEILIPYFLISGAFCGYLVERLNTSFEQYRNSQDHEHELSLRAAALRNEMELARAMQEAMLPKEPFVHPGVSIGTRWEFAREVGGDFHFFMSDGGRLGIVLGDVSGKGASAALAATSIGSLLPWLHPMDNPEKALDNLNQELLDRLPNEAFATLVLAEVDAAAGRLRLWNAGHPPPLLLHARTGEVVELDHFDSLLGVMAHWTGTPDTRQLEKDDTLLLYTDGLNETRNAAGEMFGAEGAAGVLRGNAGRSAEEIAAVLLDAVKDWGEVVDDLTIVVCKYTGPDGSKGHSG